MELRGPGASQQIERVAAILKQTPTIEAREVFTRHTNDGFARLYYGTYQRRPSGPSGALSFPPALRRDLDLIRQLGDDTGRRFFAQALPVRMPQPDVGNPAWALENADGEYSLQVAAFEPTDTFSDFKQAAADYCAWLRSKGYEAYYSHSRACSVVTVETFGSDAVFTGPDGRTYYSDQVKALQRDALLKYNLVNGAVVRVRNDQGESVPVPSRLVVVPK